MLRKFLVSVCLVVLSALTFVAAPAYAASVEAGQQIFAANCAACHIGGGNAVNPAKTLKKADLEKYGMYSAEAITTQVTKGKMAMPAFAGRLSAEDIDNVAAYVLSQADKGW